MYARERITSMQMYMFYLEQGNFLQIKNTG